MAHLTYTFKLLQIRGCKGRALHEAMRRWTLAHTEFLDLCQDKVAEFEEACTVTTPSGRKRRQGRSLQKWIREQLKPLSTYQALESSMKESLIVLLGGQLMSFLELREMQDKTGFPTGRGHSQLDFEQYLADLVTRDWTLAPDDDPEAVELDFVTLQGKVQGYRPKALYSPIEFCRYDSRRNYCLVKSEDGQLFAALYLLPEDTGFRLNGNPLQVVGKNVPLKSLSKKAALFPLATGNWVMRKASQWRPETARLVHSDGDFYLHVAFESPEPEPKPFETLLGVDRGKNRLAAIAVVSGDGRRVIHRESIMGFGLHKKRVNEVAAKIARAQASGGDYRFKYGSINDEAAHTIANRLLHLARKHRSKIVLEDLELMMRAMMAKSPKTNFNKGRKSNIYAELLRVLEYKAAMQGIQLEKVDPWWTSQTCPQCGHIDPSNRLTVKEVAGKARISRLKFRCRSCGYADDDADGIAAINIARKALFKQEWSQRKEKNTDRKTFWQQFAETFCSA